MKLKILFIAAFLISQSLTQAQAIKEESDKAVDYKAPLKEEWFQGITFQIDILSIIISVVLSMVLLYIALKYLSTIEVERSKNKKNYVKKEISIETLNKGNTFQHANKIEIRDLQNRINSLEQHIKILNDKISEIYINSQSLSAAPKSDKLNMEFTEVRSETFFLSTPNLDGSFNDSSAYSSYKEGASIYRFTRIANNRATFQIDEREASLKLALQYPDKNIDPVCDAENAFSPKGKIITVSPGEAELVSDKWIKNVKAKIRYEN